MRLAFLFPVLVSCLLLFTIARAQLVPVYETTFSESEGFVAGPLDGQQGWAVDHGSAFVDEVESENAVVLFPNSPRSRISRDFVEFLEEEVVFLRFQILGGAGEPPSSAPEWPCEWIMRERFLMFTWMVRWPDLITDFSILNRTLFPASS